MTTTVDAPTRTPTPSPTRSGPPGGRPVTGRRPLWLMWPTLLLLAGVIVVPLVIGTVIGFLDLDQYTLRDWVSAPFVGLANFTEALTGSRLLHSIWVSLVFSLLTTAICTPVGLLAAMAVNTRFRGRLVVRSLFLVPYVIPSFVTATVWRFMLQPSGVFNDLLGVFGIAGGQWLIGSKSFWSLVMVDCWAAWPFIYMMALAGLQNVPDELYESADVDGASWRQKIRHIVIPQIRGQLALGLLLSTLHHFNNFTLPFVLLGTPAPDESLTLPVNVYQTSFQVFRFGLGGAMSVITLIIMLVPAVLYLRASRLNAAAGED